MHELLLNRDIYTRLLQREILQAQEFVWLVTADLKDLHVKKGRRFVPFLEIISDLIDSGVAVRLFHAKEPGPRFREDFDKYPNLIESDLFERILCPRVHTKCVLIDGVMCFVGSPNLTGAGMGSKSENRRNFEAGILTDDPAILEPMMSFVDALYLGEHCVKCGRRDVCPDPIR